MITDTEDDSLDALLVESEPPVTRPAWVYILVVLGILVGIVVIGLLLAVVLPLAADFVIAVQRVTRTLS